MAPKGAGKKTGRAAALIGAALLSSMAPALAAEVEIPGQTLIISKEQWEGRTLEVEGHDPTQLTVFGGAEQAGAENKVNINARNNYVSLFGGYYDGVNEAVPQQVNGNTINLFGKADLTEASLFGAALFDDDDRSRQVFMGTDNTLNTYVKEVAVKELGGFNSYNFYLPESIRNRDVVLTVTGRSQTDISGSTLTALVPNRNSYK